MVVFAQSLSPGNEQRDFWSSASADTPGGKNLVGIKDPVIDALVDLVISAPDREQLIRAEPRVAQAGDKLEVPICQELRRQIGAVVAKVANPITHLFLRSFKQSLHWAFLQSLIQFRKFWFPSARDACESLLHLG